MSPSPRLVAACLSELAAILEDVGTTAKAPAMLVALEIASGAILLARSTLLEGAKEPRP
jgi:hypothetical protein